MMGAPQTKIVCHAVESISVHANAVITIEKPIKKPAMKLPDCRTRSVKFVIVTPMEISMTANGGLVGAATHIASCVRRRTDCGWSSAYAS